MKFKQKIISTLLLTALSAATIAQDKTKQVSINGIELNEAGIAKLKVDDNVKIIHLGGVDAKIGDTMTVVIDDKANKTVTMNGKKLNAEEIAELEASGKLQTFDLGSEDGNIMEKVIFLKTDGANSVDEQVKIIAKKLQLGSSESATIGFMTNIKDDGWHVISVVANSGAADAGVLAGDVITQMGGVDLTQSIENVQEIIELTQWQVGEIVDLELIRDNQIQLVSVEARKNNSADVIMSSTSESRILMLEGNNLGGLSKTISAMISSSEHDFNFNEDDINMIFPDDLSNLKIFIAQGESTSDLLGKNHKLSTLSKGLSSYFKTQGGVLVLRIDQDNAFSLKEGDVIKSIDGTKVEVPKDVIKALLKTENQHDIKVKVVRHKRNKTLKYNK